MPKVGLRESFEMQTRDRYTKVECEVGITVNGRELPSAGVLGAALEEAINLIQEHVKKSYEVVPPRATSVTAAVPEAQPATPAEPVKPAEPVVTQVATEPAQPVVVTPPATPAPVPVIPPVPTVPTT